MIGAGAGHRSNVGAGFAWWVTLDVTTLPGKETNELCIDVPRLIAEHS